MKFHNLKLKDLIENTWAPWVEGIQWIKVTYIERGPSKNFGEKLIVGLKT